MIVKSLIMTAVLLMSLFIYIVVVFLPPKNDRK